MGEEIFVHVSEMSEVPYHLRLKGVEVEYTVVANPRASERLMAGRVRLVPIERLGQ